MPPGCMAAALLGVRLVMYLVVGSICCSAVDYTQGLLQCSAAGRFIILMGMPAGYVNYLYAIRWMIRCFSMDGHS